MGAHNKKTPDDFRLAIRSDLYRMLGYYFALGVSSGLIADCLRQAAAELTPVDCDKREAVTGDQGKSNHK